MDANLTKAVLHDAILLDANLENATMDGADIKGASMPQPNGVMRAAGIPAASGPG